MSAPARAGRSRDASLLILLGFMLIARRRWRAPHPARLTAAVPGGGRSNMAEKHEFGILLKDAAAAMPWYCSRPSARGVPRSLPKRILVGFGIGAPCSCIAWPIRCGSACPVTAIAASLSASEWVGWAWQV